MKVDVNEVWKMECKEFLLRLRHLEAVQAEERYILQRQIDNNIKLKSKETIDDYMSIYREFEEQMKKVATIKNGNISMTKEEMKKRHRENLAKLGLR